MIMGKCLEQCQTFAGWDKARAYQKFHHAHYDWWAFPVDRPSSHGDKFQVGKEEWEVMRHDEKFIQALRSNAVMVCRAWGYDLVKGTPVN